jgi:hypothetical protein
VLVCCCCALVGVLIQSGFGFWFGQRGNADSETKTGESFTTTFERFEKKGVVCDNCKEKRCHKWLAESNVAMHRGNVLAKELSARLYPEAAWADNFNVTLLKASYGLNSGGGHYGGWCLARRSLCCRLLPAACCLLPTLPALPALPAGCCRGGRFCGCHKDRTKRLHENRLLHGRSAPSNQLTSCFRLYISVCQPRCSLREQRG